MAVTRGVSFQELDGEGALEEESRSLRAGWWKLESAGQPAEVGSDLGRGPEQPERQHLARATGPGVDVG